MIHSNICACALAAGLRLGLAGAQQGDQGPGDCHMRKPGPARCKGTPARKGSLMCMSRRVQVRRQKCKTKTATGAQAAVD
jgi:hypothetical protein